MERWITPIILIFESSFISTSFGFSNEKPRFSFIENRVYRQSENPLKQRVFCYPEHFGWHFGWQN